MTLHFTQHAIDRSRRRARLWTFVLLFLTGAFIARLPTTIAAIQSWAGRGANLSLEDTVQQVHRLISLRHVDKPDEDKLAAGAVSGMLEALNDPYAEFIPGADREEFTKQMTGEYVGIGCQVEIRDGWLTVVSPLEDSPAFRAGILANDRITKIDDQSTFGVSVDDCIKRLTGLPGTAVTIAVQRDAQELTFTIQREKIVSRSVRGFRRLPDGTGHWDYLLDPAARVAYVRLSQFTPSSPHEFAQALGEARAAAGDLSGLIIDLRGNPGGFLEAALEIADMFLGDQVILSVRGRDGADEHVFSGNPGDDLPNFPIVVLVNGQSASASEIIAGALSDHSRAVVLGQRSFGKGLVQTVLPLPADPRSQVKFTTQRYYLPSGRLIQRVDDSAQWGVDPTPGFFVPMTEQELVAWILHRRDQDILNRNVVPADYAEQRWTDPEWIRTTAKDKQLAAAVDAISRRIAGGQWVPISEGKDEHARIAQSELTALERARARLSRDFARLEQRIETLETLAATGKQPPRKDLWPDTLDLTGGRVVVTDKSGAPIARLAITGRDLERWLEIADLDPEPPTSAEPTAPAESTAPAPASSEPAP